MSSPSTRSKTKKKKNNQNNQAKSKSKSKEIFFYFFIIFTFFVIDMGLTVTDSSIFADKTQIQWNYQMQSFVYQAFIISMIINKHKLMVLPISHMLSLSLSNICVLISIALIFLNIFKLAIISYLMCVLSLFFSVYLFYIKTLFVKNNNLIIIFYANLITSYLFWSIINLFVLYNKYLFNKNIKYYTILTISYFIYFTFEYYYHFKPFNISFIILPHLIMIPSSFQYIITRNPYIFNSIIILLISIFTIIIKSYLLYSSQFTKNPKKSDNKNDIDKQILRIVHNDIDDNNNNLHRANAQHVIRALNPFFYSSFIAFGLVFICSIYAVYQLIISLLIPVNLTHHHSEVQTIYAGYQMEHKELAIIFIFVLSIMLMYLINKQWRLYSLWKYENVFDLELFFNVFTLYTLGSKVLFSVCIAIFFQMVISGKYCKNCFVLMLTINVTCLANCYVIYYKFLWKLFSFVREESSREPVRPNMTDLFYHILLDILLKLLGQYVMKGDLLALYIHDSISNLLFVLSIYQFHKIYYRSFKKQQPQLWPQHLSMSFIKIKKRIKKKIKRKITFLLKH